MKTLNKMNGKRSAKLRLPSILIAVFTAAVMPFAALTSTASAATAPKPGVCQAERLNVSLVAGQPANQTISGQLCLPLYWSSNPRTVDVLVAGATYNSSYWDFGYDNAQYSYVDDTLLAGRATFNYDDIGTGQSSHPLSSDITFASDAYILHQLIGWVQQQSALKTAKVNIVAHSKGSGVALEEASLYPKDASALVITGLLHSLTMASNSLLAAAFYPASQDPQFAGQNLDSGYETTVPGVRGSLFYGSSAHPNVIAYDEAHKDVFSGSEFANAFAQVLAPPAQNISNTIMVPVLTVVGQQDALFCGAGGVNCASNATVKAAEAPYYAHAASFAALVIPDTGHDIALHPTNVISFAEINAWLSQH